jgi:hypothetical protein
LGCANEDKVIYRLLHHCQFLVSDERRPYFGQGHNAIDAFRNFIAVRNGVQYPLVVSFAYLVHDTIIAFRSHRNGDAEIYVMDADGSDQTNLTNYHSNDDWSPAWSPDGAHIAFASMRPEGEGIWVMQADGSNPRPVATPSGVNDYPTWSPDSQRIAWNCTFGRFLYGRVADFEICVVKADGTGLAQIASCAEGGHFPDWYQPLETTASHVLIDEDRVSIRVNSNEAGRPRCALVCLLLQLHSLCLQLALQLADISKRGELLSVAVPAGVEGENVLVKHALKQSDNVITVLQDQPVLRGIPGEDLETKLLVECLRSLEVLDSQADRKCT